MSGQNKYPGNSVVRPYHFPPLMQDALQSAEYAASQQQFDSSYEAGHQQGYQEGLEQGKQQGLAEGKKEGNEQGLIQGRKIGEQLGKQHYDEMLKPLQAIAAQLQQSLELNLKDQKEQLLQLVMQVTQRVLTMELALQPQQILKLVEESCASLPEKPQDVRIYLNSKDLQNLRSKGFTAYDSWPLLEDKNLKQGDCRVETQSSVIESSLGQQVAECISVIEEKMDGTHGR